MFEVGKKYKIRHSSGYGPYECLFVTGHQAVLKNVNGENAFMVWDFKNYIEYIPPPKMVKKEGWINIYKGGIIGNTKPWPSEEKAKNKGGGISGYITSIRIEWEEEEK